MSDLLSRAFSLGLRNVDTARLAVVSPAHLSNVRAGRRCLSPEAAARLAVALDALEMERRRGRIVRRLGEAALREVQALSRSGAA